MFMMSSSRKRLQNYPISQVGDVRQFWKRPLLLLLSPCWDARLLMIRSTVRNRRTLGRSFDLLQGSRCRQSDNSVYREALQRANRQVAQENLQRYREYLAAGEGVKAFARLQAVRQQDPDLAEAAEEEKLWSHVLLSGRVRFEFEQLQTNVEAR